MTVVIGDGAIENFNLDLEHSNAKFSKSQAQKPYQHFMLNIAHTKIALENINTEELELHSAHGLININEVAAKDITFEGAHSRFNVVNVKANSVTGDWAHGDITFTISDIDELNIDAAHGAINLTQHQGKSLDIESAHGRVYANTLITEQAYLKNKHGPIEFIGAANKMRVTNAHGQIDLTQLANQVFDIDASNRHGNILLFLPKNSDYNYKINNNGLVTERESTAKNTVNLSTSHGIVKIKQH
ncbi:MAG: DUF4097 family beta strand repeat-containing protein [Thalassotalea sp.]